MCVQIENINLKFSNVQLFQELKYQAKSLFGVKMTILRVLLILFLVLPSVSIAKKPWLSVTYGYGSYSMQDLNEFISEINNASGGNFIDEINGGQIFSVCGGFQYPSGVSFGIGIEFLVADSKYSDPGGFLEIQIPATVYKGLIEYQFNTSSNLVPHISGELGMLQTDGQISWAVGEEGESLKSLGGSSVFLSGVAGIDLRVSKTIAIRGQAGYRFADIAYLDNGIYKTNFGLDYSGYLLRAGIKVTFS
jgi:hypothetical protein